MYDWLGGFGSTNAWKWAFPCSHTIWLLLTKQNVFPYLPGVQFDIDLPNKKVYIESEHNVDTLLETLKKTGKSASYLGEKSVQ